MDSMYDRILKENTLFEMFNSDAYDNTLVSLKLALEQVTAKILSISNDTWTKKRLKEVQTLINKEIQKAYSGTLPSLQDQLPEIAAITASNIMQGYFTLIPTKVLDAITSNDFNVQGYTAEELFKTLADDHARKLRVLVASQVSQGKTSNTIASKLLSDKVGLSKGQLKTAIFTTITEARANVQYDAYAQLEEKTGVIIGYQYIAVLDGRTTEYCRNHDHRKYFQSIKDIQKYINVHWNCRSKFVPLTKSSNNDGTRTSIFGEVPDEPYSKWFSNQSDDFQKSVLSKSKYQAYKNGTYKIGGLPDVLGKNMTLKDIKSNLKK